MIVTCTDEKFQKISIQATHRCLWSMDDACSKEVLEFWGKNLDYVVMGVARTMTEENYINLSGSVDAPVATTSSDFSDVFGK